MAVTHGQDVIVANTGYSSERTELCVQRMLERKVDGVAIMTSEMDSHLIDRLNSRDIPIVFLDTGLVGKGVSNIVIDYSTGIHAVVAHLSEFGHQRIAFISGPMHLPSAVIRRDAFLAAAKEFGVEVPEDLIEEANHRADGGGAAMGRLLDRPVRPTAVMASNDLTAIGAIGAIHQRGLRVPEDISVAGFDDIDFCMLTHPTLTTVRLSRRNWRIVRSMRSSLRTQKKSRWVRNTGSRLSSSFATVPARIPNFSGRFFHSYMPELGAQLIEREIQLQHIDAGFTQHSKLSPCDVFVDQFVHCIVAQAPSRSYTVHLVESARRCDVRIKS